MKVSVRSIGNLHPDWSEKLLFLACPVVLSGINNSSALFGTVHPLNVVLVVSFELLSFEFKSVCNQAGLWGPGLNAEPDLPWDLESF